MMVQERRDAPAADDDAEGDRLRAWVDALPRPVRFLLVGGAGLMTDLCAFTLQPWHLPHPIAARAVSLALATLLTWRLNRAFTFNASGRHPAVEATRYASVTLVSQGTSFLLFSVLVLTVFAAVPQAALLSGAAVGAVLGYFGHKLFAFAPRSHAEIARGGRA